MPELLRKDTGKRTALRGRFYETDGVHGLQRTGTTESGEGRMSKVRWVTTVCECRLQRKDGNLIWIHIFLSTQGWKIWCPQLPAIAERFKSVTKAKEAAIREFEKLEDEAS